MKASEFFGLIVSFFGVITLLNLFDIMQKLNEVNNEVSNYYDINVNVQLSTLSIVTWLGIAFTQFVLGAIMVFANSEKRDKDEIIEKSEKEVENKKPLIEPFPDKYPKKE